MLSSLSPSGAYLCHLFPGQPLSRTPRGGTPSHLHKSRLKGGEKPGPSSKLWAPSQSPRPKPTQAGSQTLPPCPSCPRGHYQPTQLSLLTHLCHGPKVVLPEADRAKHPHTGPRFWNMHWRWHPGDTQQETETLSRIPHTPAEHFPDVWNLSGAGINQGHKSKGTEVCWILSKCTCMDLQNVTLLENRAFEDVTKVRGEMRSHWTSMGLHPMTRVLMGM